MTDWNPPMTYYAHLHGFTGNFETLDALREWANNLVATYDWLAGKTLQIHKARSIASGGTAATYNATPDREIVIGG